MSEKMRAVVIRGYGSNDAVAIEVVDRPEPRSGKVLLRVRAAGVN